MLIIVVVLVACSSLCLAGIGFVFIIKSGLFKNKKSQYLNPNNATQNEDKDEDKDIEVRDKDGCVYIKHANGTRVRKIGTFEKIFGYSKYDGDMR